ncbi:hypothetical protein H0H93_011700 [Arthromyces matolae]|nr:hypothetical protein H0H93_011700 [Arthromyces matolae]
MPFDTTAESTALPSPTSTFTSPATATISTSIISSSSTSASSTSTPSTGSHHANVVGGAIVGSTIGAALLLGIFAWWLNRRRHLVPQAVLLSSPTPSTTPPPGHETTDMRQYLENTTVPTQALTESSINTSLPSPKSANFTNTTASRPGSVKSLCKTSSRKGDSDLETGWQTPCLIASYLGGVCNAGQFTVGPLDVGKVYIGPTIAEANECRCSGVFYNLVSACAGCQGRAWEEWSEYNANCSTVYPAIFIRTIPSGTRVPHYAYLDPTPDDTFNVTAATQVVVLDAPESTAPPQTTGTSTSIIAPSVTPSTKSSKSSSKAGPIAGGVVGGVVALALIAALVFWWTRRHRSRTAPSAEANYNAVQPTSPPPMTSTPQPAFPAAMPTPRLYDPSDPSTYPAATTDYTGSTQAVPAHVTGSTYTGSNAASGRYTGAPEI